MTTQASTRTPRFGPSRAEVLDHLRDVGAAEPIAVIAAAVGLHQNTIRFHLDALVELGLVDRQAETRTQPGRPRVLYRAESAPSQHHYRDLATVLVRHFAGPMADRANRAETAGEAWGAELLAELPAVPEGTLPRMLGCLASLGYQPRLIDGPPTSIALHPCPYSDLAGEDPETVCRLHLGLMRGLLDDAATWEVTDLEPYATPELCVVHLAQKEGVS